MQGSSPAIDAPVLKTIPTVSPYFAAFSFPVDSPIMRPHADQRAKRVKPLDDILVIEIDSWMASPSAGAILTDLGARVIKIEP